MKKLYSTIKKVGISLGTVLVVFGMLFGVLYFLPNELSFKIYNAQAIAQTDNQKAQELFDRAVSSFPKWSLIARNNVLGKMYDEKKYDELAKELDEVIQNECNIEQEKISEFCENIFYLDGLVQYRLGENLQTDEQKEFYQKAIDSFQKTLAINNENTWAKENIDFILQQFAQQQSQQQQGGGDQNQDNQQEQGDKQQGEEGQSQDGQQQNSDEQKDSQGTQGDQQQGEQQEGKGGKNGDNAQEESRLPQNIQDALEQAQKEMEQSQDQEGFNRSKSAAQKNNLENQDPFEQMVQQFFGGMLGNQMQNEQKNFTNEIQNPNEKDW